MNNVADEMRAIMERSDADIFHYGVGHLNGGHSGRYQWGSGKNPNQSSGELRSGNMDFADRVDKMRKEKFTYTDPETGEVYTGDKAIYKSMGITSRSFRAQYSIATNDRRLKQITEAQKLRDEGLSTSEIARRMNKPRSTIEGYLEPTAKQNSSKAMTLAESMKSVVDEKGMVDIGKGVERELGVSKERMTEAVAILQEQGYEVYGGRMPQVTNPGNYTTVTILCPPGTEHRDIYNYEDVHSFTDYISRDGGATIEKKFNYPASMDSDRLMIRYKEDGGIDKDGVMELRPGVADLDLGESKYAQVRIMVNDKYYLKGVAVYGKPEDFPPGVDVIFNTNKTSDKPMEKVLKPIKDDPNNPFGSLIKDADQGGQYWYDPHTGKRCDGANDPAYPDKQLGLINKRADEGDWTEWSNALPSQFLSKQSEALAKQQLNTAKIDKQTEYDSIMAITNPTIKKYYLEKFADECDSAAVDLKAAALPGQQYHVIIPNNTLKDTEIYAPNYENGTQLALIRYPHGGTFEIPIVTVNNKNRMGIDLIGKNSKDAVCINAKVAERLSGADFDGDTVMCIPTNTKNVKITSTDPLPGLVNWDPKDSYAERPGMKYMKDPYHDPPHYDHTQMEMGKISNLITDMTLGGASRDELERAVKHSMVVIDAGKHKLDYTKSEQDNNIQELRELYQRTVREDGTIKVGGASTLISSSKSRADIVRTQGDYRINDPKSPDFDPSRPEGAKIWKEADDRFYAENSYNKKTKIRTYTTEDGQKIKYDVTDPEARKKYTAVKKTAADGTVYFESADGKYRYRTAENTTKTTKMEATDDARTLLSADPTPMEVLYADYANSLKSMANQARLSYLDTPRLKYNSTAAKEYKVEVASLNDKLNKALLNAPREREAQRIANVEIQKRTRPQAPTGEGGGSTSTNPRDGGEGLTGKEVKKVAQQAITQAREDVQAVSRRNRNIDITDREWQAIQAGAITNDKLVQILANTDPDKLRDRATPRQSKQTLSPSQISRIKALASSSNYTTAEIAAKFNVSVSTIQSYI